MKERMEIPRKEKQIQLGAQKTNCSVGLLRILRKYCTNLAEK